jgi:hypothetical protein
MGTFIPTERNVSYLREMHWNIPRFVGICGYSLLISTVLAVKYEIRMSDSVKRVWYVRDSEAKV